MTLSRMQKGIIVAALHLAIVSSLGAKLLYDRSNRPRVWVKTAAYDPELFIRGRYISLRLEVEAREMKKPEEPKNPQAYVPPAYSQAYLRVEGDKLIAVKADDNDYTNSVGVIIFNRADVSVVRVAEPVLFFIPEHAQDPSRRPAGEELWVEVTIPKKGPPRPIRLGIKKDGGPIQPFDVRQ